MSKSLIKLGYLLGVKLAQEEALGIPSKSTIHDLPTITDPKTWQFALQKHEADVRGLHYDLRLGDSNTGHGHSWALSEDGLPKPGESTWAIGQPTHTIPYFDFQGKIPTGYGAGKVTLPIRTQAEIRNARPGHISFNLYTGKGPQEFTLHEIHDGKWKLYNRTLTRERIPGMQDDKPKYKDRDPETLDVHNENEILQSKIDGAHALVYLPPKGSARVVSYRITDRQQGVIEHSPKFEELYHGFEIPKELRDTVVRAELYATHPDTGKAISAKDVGALLNSNTWKSREKQEQLGKLKAALFDVIRFKGKDVSNKPYGEKLDILKNIDAATPATIHLPRTAQTSAEKQRLLSDIKSGKEPTTVEGVVVHNLTESTPPSKVKYRQDFDVHIRGVFPGAGKHQDNAAGGFTFSHTPDGPIVGKIGTGFTDALRQDMWKRPEVYRGAVAKVLAHELYGTKEAPGALRVGTFKGFHLDKTDPDRLQQIYTKQ